LRKKGYFNKRIEANINIHGCILCFEGLGSINPGVVDNLTERNTAGTLGANIQMKPIELGKAVKIDNIYYDLARATLRPEAIKELDKMANVLRDNPALLIEIGSHTDARGGATENLALSEQRAQAAVDYIVSKGVNANRITAKGYGETKLVNGCADGVQCTEEQHQLNRRTEFRVTGISDIDPYENKSLKEIIEEQEFMDKIMKGDVEEYKAGDTPPVAAQTTAPKRNAEHNSETHDSSPAAKASEEPPQNMPQQNAMSQAEIDRANDEARKAAIAAALGSEATAQAEAKSAEVAASAAEYEQPTITEAPTNPIPSETTGFKIQLIDEPEPITLSNPLFKAFKSVYAEVVEDKHYTYLIGDYKSEAGAKAYLLKIIKQYPDAKIIHFQDGKRVE
jgi:outer membrane protein OmpA-like peptidoglycan-associated protein